MANEKLKTVNIKGKEYVEVNERIKAFRKNFPDHALVTKLIQLDEETCVMEAQVLSPTGAILANGHASENRKASNVNQTSYVENCETSAWGRALGNFGIGVDTAICSAQELLVAIGSQNTQPAQQSAPAAPAPKAPSVQAPAATTTQQQNPAPKATKKSATGNDAVEDISTAGAPDLDEYERTVYMFILRQPTLEGARDAIAKNNVNVMDAKWGDLRVRLNEKFS